jgi:hypothetical protein
MTYCMFNWVFGSISSQCSVFSAFASKHFASRRLTDVSIHIASKKKHRRRGAKCFEANAENTEHRDETRSTSTNLEVNRLLIWFDIC